MLGHLKTLVRTVYDFGVYREVAAQPPRRTAGYFALVVSLSSLVIALATVVQLRAGVRRELLPELPKLPTVTIRDGVASANVPQPWVKRFEQKETGGQTVVFAVDTTGKMTDFAPGEQGMILTRDKILMRRNWSPFTEPVSLAGVKDAVISPETIADHYLPMLYWIVLGLCLVLLPLYFTAAKLIHALLVSLVGMIAAVSGKRGLGYGEIFAISIYGLTPAILLDVARSVAGVHLAHFWVVYILIAAGVTAYAVHRTVTDDPATKTDG